MAIVPIFNPTSELANPIGVPTKLGKTEIETHQVIAEIKVSKC